MSLFCVALWENLSTLSFKTVYSMFCLLFLLRLIAPTFPFLVVLFYVFGGNPDFGNCSVLPEFSLVFWVPFCLFVCFVIFYARNFPQIVLHI